MNILLHTTLNFILFSSCTSLVLSSLFKCSKCYEIPFFSSSLIPIFSNMFVLFPLVLGIKKVIVLKALSFISYIKDWRYYWLFIIYKSLCFHVFCSSVATMDCLEFSLAWRYAVYNWVSLNRFCWFICHLSIMYKLERIH